MKREVSKDEFEFGIYEVYYNEDGTIKGYTQDSVVPVVDSADGLNHELRVMLKAFDKDVLKYE
jgi:hypothetical protein